MQLRIDEILEIVGGKITQLGNKAGNDTLVSGVNSLDRAESVEISFLGNEKYFQQFLETNAAVVLIPGNFPGGLPQVPAGPVLIGVENPSYAFAQVLKHLSLHQRDFEVGIAEGATVAKGVKINPERVSVKAGAVIEAGCVIGNGCEIGANAVIEAGAKLGEDCLVHSNVTVRELSEIGDRVILQPGCIIGSDGYGYELVEGKHVKVDQVGIVVLGDDVEIGANTTIDRARFGKTVIGEGTKIDNLVQIAHNVEIGNHSLVVSQSGIAGSTKVGNYVTIAAQVGIGGHVEIKDKAVLVARTGATKTLEGGVIYSGKPARPIKVDQRKEASALKLPQLMKEFRALKKRVEELEG